VAGPQPCRKRAQHPARSGRDVRHALTCRRLHCILEGESLIRYSRIGIVHHGLLQEARDLARAITSRYGGGASWTATQSTLSKNLSRLPETDLIVTIGGDGTILRGVHVAAPQGIPVLGVNMGRVGFMSEVDADDALDGLEWYLNGEAHIEERSMLRAEVTGEDGPFDALNDIIIARGEVLRVIEIETRIDGELLSVYRGDGVVVSTPTGSTGYALALGGPVLDPMSDHMFLKPIAAHMSQAGGVVVKAQSTFELKLMSEHPAVFSADGFLNCKLRDGQTARVVVSPYRARFLRRHPPSYFWASLSRKLGMRQSALARKPSPNG
jgi:NAD+ kinase